MTYDSSVSPSDSDVKTKFMKTPAASSLDFVRQFARVYNHLACKSCHAMIAN